MSATENAALDVEAIKSGMGNQISGQTIGDPAHNSITIWSVAQGISALLLSGKENAIPLQDLARITGLNTREVRRRIQKERLAGIPILSNCQAGYFLPSDDTERSRCVASMLHRAAEIMKSARAIEKGGRE